MWLVAVLVACLQLAYHACSVLYSRLLITWYSALLSDLLLALGCLISPFSPLFVRLGCFLADSLQKGYMLVIFDS